MFRFCFLFALCFAASILSADTSFTGHARVIDADTIVVTTRAGKDLRVRIHGIDAPEQNQTCKSEHNVAWACGAWASQQMHRLAQGRIVECRQTDYDHKYNRLVAMCFVDGVDIGQRLVQGGVAFAYRKYAMTYDFEERSAAARDAGLHSFRVQSPEQFRRTRAVGRFPIDPKCRIKGNISAQGVHIFHRPGQRHYEVTGIRPEHGERWFCSEYEAIIAGWRAARG